MHCSSCALELQTPYHSAIAFPVSKSRQQNCQGKQSKGSAWASHLMAEQDPEGIWAASIQAPPIAVHDSSAARTAFAAQPLACWHAASSSIGSSCCTGCPE